MASIYDDNGDLDIQAAAQEVRDVRGVTNPLAASAQLERIRTAALIDIASSLRTLGIESATAMGWVDPVTGEETSAGREAQGDAVRDELTGRAAVTEDTPAGTIVGLKFTPAGETQRTGNLLDQGGESEGLPWVAVRFFDTNTEERAFLANLEVVVPLDEGDEVKEEQAAIDAEQGDGLDADFAGEQDEDAARAAAELKAKTKAAKKKGKGKS